MGAVERRGVLFPESARGARRKCCSALRRKGTRFTAVNLWPLVVLVHSYRQKGTRRKHGKARGPECTYVREAISVSLQQRTRYRSKHERYRNIAKLKTPTTMSAAPVAAPADFAGAVGANSQTNRDGAIGRFNAYQRPEERRRAYMYLRRARSRRRHLIH